MACKMAYGLGTFSNRQSPETDCYITDHSFIYIFHIIILIVLSHIDFRYYAH